jgi:hypothetical protein
MIETLMLARQSDRRKRPEMRPYRRLTAAEIMALGPGERVLAVLRSGRVGEARVNGAIRTWKRDPGRVEIPMKYGFGEYFTLSLREAEDILVAEIGEDENAVQEREAAQVDAQPEARDGEALGEGEAAEGEDRQGR